MFVCDLCEKPIIKKRELKPRKNGKHLCDRCWKWSLHEKQKYDSHWFVRSLKPRSPQPPPLKRQYKSLPGQLPLIDTTEESEPEFMP